MASWTQDQLDAMIAVLTGTHDRLDTAPKQQGAYTVDQVYAGTGLAPAPAQDTATDALRRSLEAGATAPAPANLYHGILPPPVPPTPAERLTAGEPGMPALYGGMGISSPDAIGNAYVDPKTKAVVPASGNSAVAAITGATVPLPIPRPATPTSQTQHPPTQEIQAANSALRKTVQDTLSSPPPIVMPTTASAQPYPATKQAPPPTPMLGTQGIDDQTMKLIELTKGINNPNMVTSSGAISNFGSSMNPFHAGMTTSPVRGENYYDDVTGEWIAKPTSSLYQAPPPIPQSSASSFLDFIANKMGQPKSGEASTKQTSTRNTKSEPATTAGALATLLTGGSSAASPSSSSSSSGTYVNGAAVGSSGYYYDDRTGSWEKAR